jgi:D-glycero-D-manno-heptose 1,7-bisphosphate phosphatase
MPEPLSRYRLCIFDADDTLRRSTVADQPCPRTDAEWELIPGVARTLRRIPWNQDEGPFLGLASNQDQVGYGHLSEQTARALLRDLARAAAGIAPADEALQLCPHRLEIDCECRKPRPGMLLRIMDFYGVSPEETLFVGNTEADRKAAEAAGTSYADAAEVFSSSAGPSGRRTRRIPRPAGEDSCGGDGARRTRG